MTEDDKILHLVLDFNKFDEIKNGLPNYIYLECNERWNNLFETKKYCKVRLCRGLYKNPETMLYKIKNINLYFGKNYFNKPKVWIVRLGERIN